MSKKKSQEYLGNGEHEWEVVTVMPNGIVERLRVPGGWLYHVAMADKYTDTFVPMPNVVKHKV